MILSGFRGFRSHFKIEIDVSQLHTISQDLTARHAALQDPRAACVGAMRTVVEEFERHPRHVRLRRPSITAGTWLFC